MKVAIISRCETRSLFIIRQVIQRWPDHLVIRPVRATSTKSETRAERFRRRVQKLARHPVKTFSSRFEGAAHAFYHWYEGNVDQQITRLLFASSEPPQIDMNRVDVPWYEVNSDATERQIRDFSPDVLLVCVAPILRPNVFTIPRHGTINVHPGLVPSYRGEHTLFWPLYFREYDQLGITVHYVDEGIDTGDVLATGCPATQPDDNEATITARSTRLAARLTCDVLAASQWGRLSGLQQSAENGREFRHRERTGWKELWYLAQREIVGHRPLPMIERTDCHFARSDDDPDADADQPENAVLKDVRELSRLCRKVVLTDNLSSSMLPLRSDSAAESQRQKSSESDRPWRQSEDE